MLPSDQYPYPGINSKELKSFLVEISIPIIFTAGNPPKQLDRLL